MGPHCPSITFYGATMGNESGLKRNKIGLLFRQGGHRAVHVVILIVIVSIIVTVIAIVIGIVLVKIGTK